MSRISSVARGGFFASPPRVVDVLTSWLQPATGVTDRRPSLLDPCAGEGEAIARLTEAVGGVAHAIELNEDRAAACRSRVPLTVCGDALEAQVADGAYAAILLNSPYDHDRQDDEGRLEGLFLTRYLPALAPGGVLIFIVRRSTVGHFAARLTTACTRLCLLPFPAPEAEAFDQVVILGIKKQLPQADPTQQSVLRQAAGTLSTPPLATRPPDQAPYRLPVVLTAPPPPRITGAQAARQLLLAARRQGVWARAEVADRLLPTTGAPFGAPVMPLRLTHLAMLLVAGYFDHSVVTAADGRRLLVKGRALKRYIEIEVDAESGASTEREAIRTELSVLDLATGQATTIDSSTPAGCEALGAFLEEHQAALAERVRADYQPLYSVARRPEFAALLARLRRRPLGAQRDVIGALTLSLERHGVACAASAPGTGKTYMASAIAFVLWQRAGGRGCFRVAVSCPPHLVLKWKRESELTIPGVRATVIEGVSALERALADWTPGLHCLIIARTTGKLDSYKRPALGRRLAVNADEGRVWVPCCPACREPVTVADATIVDTRRRCAACGEILYQARAAPPKHGRGSFRWTTDGPVAGQPREGPRRYPLARRIKQHDSGAIDLYISDEYHESKGGDTAAGMADGTLAAAARRTLLLSGTISSGKASGSFYLLYRFVAAVRQEFKYTDYTKWVDRYGIWQRRWKPDPNDRYRYGASSQRRIPAGAPQEKPGIMPAMVRHVLDHTAFLRLEDVTTDLPPYTETVELVEMSPAQANAYATFEADLLAIIIPQLHAGGTKLLGAYLQALLTFPDNCINGEVVRHPDTGHEIASAPALPATVWYPKEVALRDLALRERQRGRRVLIYVTHVERRDLTGRLRQVLEDAGLRVAVLKQQDAAARDREAWLRRRGAEGVDVLLTNPNLVKTGLDLWEYPVVTFAEIDYSIFTLRQASKRSWRIGQTQPVTVCYFAYRDTMQATALSLVARKLRSALQLEGDTFDAGLAASDADDDSLLAMLARSLRKGERLDDAEQLFAAVRQADAERHHELVAGDDAESADDGIDAPSARSPFALPPAATVRLVSLAAGATDVLPGPPPVDGGFSARRVIGRSLTDLAWQQPAQRRSSRPVPTGQLRLFGEEADAPPAAEDAPAPVPAADRSRQLPLL